MKIGILKETKKPIDNRVALTPTQIALLNKEYPNSEIVVQKSDIRAFSDEEYLNAGVKVVDNLEDCDYLFGIKEAKINTLLSNKHYFFFGHIAKMQEYNRPLLQAFINKSITFTDYEYLTDNDGSRLCAFGWWAGVVGVYYTLRGYGLKSHLYNLPKPNIHFTLKELLNNLKSIKLPTLKILVTGNGRVSHGAQYVLNEIGCRQLDKKEYLNNVPVDILSYHVATLEEIIRHKENKPFSRKHFKEFPFEYNSIFENWSHYTDILISCHYWGPNDPIYLSADDLKNPNNKIRMIGDVTCDIMGSIKSTLRSSTHDNPYYDYNPLTEKEEEAFTDKDNITVMAVDTCPNALPRDASDFFGSMLIQNVFKPLLEGGIEKSEVIEKGTIVKKGCLTNRFSYLEVFAKGQ